MLQKPGYTRGRGPGSCSARGNHVVLEPFVALVSAQVVHCGRRLAASIGAAHHGHRPRRPPRPRLAIRDTAASTGTVGWQNADHWQLPVHRAVRLLKTEKGESAVPMNPRFFLSSSSMSEIVVHSLRVRVEHGARPRAGGAIHALYRKVELLAEERDADQLVSFG